MNTTLEEAMLEAVAVDGEIIETGHCRASEEELYDMTKKQLIEYRTLIKQEMKTHEGESGWGQIVAQERTAVKMICRILEETFWWESLAREFYDNQFLPSRDDTTQEIQERFDKLTKYLNTCPIAKPRDYLPIKEMFDAVKKIKKILMYRNGEIPSENPLWYFKKRIKKIS